MKALKFMLVVCFAVTITLPVRTIVEGQEAPLSATEAPTGFDNVSNGFTTATQFKKDKDIFEDREEIANGLGPTYNAQSCAECHQNPVTGGISQVTELRAGHLESEVFVPAAGGSLIHSRATDASIEEFVEEGENIRSFRTSLNTLGDGFVECIDDQTLINISLNQPRGMQGLYFNVPVLEAGKMLRLGRFGWKNQHASLVSFSSDAYLNEMGITNSIGTGDNAVENTSLGRFVGFGSGFDPVPEPEDNGDDVLAFARFMRATKAPPRDDVLAATADAQKGSILFDQIGCNICHVRTIVTAPPGTPINGGAFTVPAALGNKIIHPFGDFLLHDVGTGDGIQQNPPADTRIRLRTAPLWGLRTRNRLMHDGESLTLRNAIVRHAGEASGVTSAFTSLTADQRRQLVAFLRTL